MIDRDKIKAADRHWTEVMELAEKYGFISYAHGGVAILMTHENRLESLGEEEYLKTMRVMFGVQSPSKQFGRSEER